MTSIKDDLEAINNDMSFGVSFSQKARNDHAKALCSKIASGIIDYETKLIKAIESKPDEAMTEQIAHNIGVLVFYDVQLEDSMKMLDMPVNEEL